jgi:hypothetical protein
MAQPRLTEYLIKLATDADALERHRRGNKREREVLMEAAGLTVEQQAAVLSADSRRITEEVIEELKRESPGRPGGNVIHIQVGVPLPPN